MPKNKIFITEDEFIISINLERKLNALGYNVIGTAASGEECLEKIAEEQPDLILMDIMLAGDLDGIETAEIIKKKYDIPLIFLTAYSAREIHKRAALTEPYAYIIKPAEERELEINIAIALYKNIAEKELKKKREELEKINLNLDQLVKDRTAELEELNSELKREIEEKNEAQETQKRLVQVIEQAKDHILITNTKGVIEYANPELLNAVGYVKEEVLGKTPRIFKSGIQSESFYKKLWETIIRGEVFINEFLNRKKNGELYNAEEIIMPLKDSDGKITHFASIGRDITEKKEYEKEMIQTQENERERISRELHDGLGQTITALKFAVGSLSNNENKEFINETTISDIKKQMEEMTKEIRNISFNLMPSILGDYGLKAALSKMIKNTLINSELDITLFFDEKLERFEKSLEIGLYRIIQEALNNTIKHAKATRIRIDVRQEGSNIVLKVIDNGIGSTTTFLKDNAMHTGQGLRNMKQRALMLNGIFEMKSRKNKGTQIIIKTPIYNG